MHPSHFLGYIYNSRGQLTNTDKTNWLLFTICRGNHKDWTALTWIPRTEPGWCVDQTLRCYELRTQASQEWKNCNKLSCQRLQVMSWGIRLPTVKNCNELKCHQLLVTSWGARIPTEQEKLNIDTFQRSGCRVSHMYDWYQMFLWTCRKQERTDFRHLCGPVEKQGRADVSCHC